jgi:hypothetical protein
MVAAGGTIVITDTGRGELIGQPPNSRTLMIDGRLVIVQDGVPTAVALRLGGRRSHFLSADRELTGPYGPTPPEPRRPCSRV